MGFDDDQRMTETRQILRLTWPVMLTSLNWTLMHLIDVAVVGQVGTEELGKLAAGRAITFISIVMGLTAMTGVLVFTARADGAGDKAATGAVFRQALLLASALGLPVMLLLLIFAETLVRGVGVAEPMVMGGAAVVRAMALAYPFQFINGAVSYFLEGASQPRRVMIVNLAMLPFNAVLAWGWAGGHLGLPAMGAVGAVLATAAVSGFGATALVLSALSLPDATERGLRDRSIGAWRAALSGLPRLIRFGLIPSFASGLEIAGFAWLIALSTRLGPVSAAAFQAVFSLHNFTFGIAMGVASAAGVRVANAVGARQPGRVAPRLKIALMLVSGAMFLLGLLLTLFAPAIVLPFSGDPAVQTLAAAMLMMLAPLMFLDGLQLVCVYALRSLGDQMAAGINSIIAYFLVTALSGWWLVSHGMGAYGLIWATIIGMIAAATLQGARLWWVVMRLR